MRLEVRVDLAAGDPGAAELARLLDGLDVAALAAAATPATRAPDAFRYDLTLAGDDGRRELAFGQGGVPEELRPVIRALERRAMAELRARRGGAG
jgi:hypothetical protein